ncbi:DUF1456 family protein [Pseudomonadota bacterium]
MRQCERLGLITKPELSGIFRKERHRHYNACRDQLLRG